MLYNLPPVNFAALSDFGWLISEAANRICAALSPIIFVQASQGLARRSVASPSERHPARLSASAHWQRVADVIDRSIETRLIALRRHSDALTQIDAAEFALSRVVDELAAVMPGLRRTSTAGWHANQPPVAALAA